MRGTRWAWVVGGVLLAGLGAARPAQADVFVSMDDTTVVASVLAEPDRTSYSFVLEHFLGEGRNGIRVRPRSVPDFEADPGAIRTGDEVCLRNPAFNDVVCSVLPTAGVITGSEHRDLVFIGGSNVACTSAAATPFQVDLGAGNDTLGVGHPSSSGCTGMEAGINRLHPQFTSASGDAGSDTLGGGRLADTLLGGTGNDTLDGGDGNDTLDGQGGADQMIGRGGTDTATYAARGSAVTVSLDSTANDGAAGENDNVSGVQIVIGGAGADDLTGNDGANTLRGESGNDEIEGRGGADVLTGGLGNDFIDSRETPVVADTITCGLGFDTVSADLEDRFGTLASCDNVERFAVDDGPPGRILGRSLRVRHNGTARLRLKCPRRARVACRGRLRLTTATRSRRTLAAARYRVPLGRTRAIRLSLSRGATRRARRAKVLIAATRERGLSKKGPRSSTVRLNARR